MKSGRDSIYQKLMSIGKISGCHQIPDRSFFIKGKQFPICARCTGVLVGNIMACIGFFLFVPPLEFCVIGCAVMFVDWYIQYIKILKSTNTRRLITGIIGGYSLATLYCLLIRNVIELILLRLQIGGIK